MPRGSRKRKALKKPKPGELPSSQGEAELETGLEDMGKDWEDMAEGSPSPKAMDEAAEAVAEVGAEEGKELISQALGEEGEVAEAEEASAPTISEADAPEVEGEAPVHIAQEDLAPQIKENIDIPLGKTELDSPPESAPSAEIKPEVDADTGPTRLERHIDDVGAPLIGIASVEADETEPREAAPNKMETEPREAQIDSDSQTDESPVEVGWMAEVAQGVTGPENVTSPPDISIVGVEPGVNEDLVGMDASPVDAPPENDKATVARDLETDAASANVEAKVADDTPVETALETDEGPVSGQSDIDEAVVERQPEADAVVGNLEMDPRMVAPPLETQTEMDGYPFVREVNAEAPYAISEPAATDDASSATAEETVKGPYDVHSEVEEATEQSQSETDEVPSNLELETTAERKLENEAAQVGEAASPGEIEQEVEPAGPRIQSQRDVSESEIEATTDVAAVEGEPEQETTMREVDSKTEVSPSKNKPDVDATLDDTGKDQVDEAEIKSEEEATVDDTEDDAAQAGIEPEPEEGASMEAGAEAEVENDYTSLETAADALKEINLAPESVTGAFEEIEWPSTQEVEEIVKADTEPEEGTPQEVERGHEAEPADVALAEASEVSGSKEDFNQGVETPLEADTKPEGGTTRAYEPEAETEAEVLGPNEIISDQQDLTEAEPDGWNVEDHDLQIQQQEREADSGVEADQEGLSPVSAYEAALGDGYASSLREGDVPANPGTDAPEIEQENPEESAVISPPGDVLIDERADATETEVVDSEQGAADAQPDESREYTIERRTADIDDIYDQEEALSAEVHRSIVPSEEDTGIEQRPAITVDQDVSVGEEPHAAELEQYQPTLDDKQDLDIEPSTIDVHLDDSEMVEQGLSSTVPPKSGMTVNDYEPKDGVAVQNFDSPSGDLERDIVEEDAALSTVAEAGSVINDFDERASYQQLPMDFPSSEQDADISERIPDFPSYVQDANISESRESDDISSLRSPKLDATGVTEQIDGEGRESVDSSTPRGPELVGMGLAEQVGGEHTDSREDNSKVSGDSLKDEFGWKSAQDLEAICEHEEVSPAPVKEITIVEGEENGQEAVPPTFGIVPALDSLAVPKELMPKDLPSNMDGLRSLPSSEAPTYDLVIPGEGTVAQDNAAVNANEVEIRTVEVKDLKAAASTPEEDSENTSSNGAPLRSASWGKEKEDLQAFRQQNTQEASLPVIIPPQDVKQRALAQGNLKSNEHSSGGGTLTRRTNWLGCCGMFDLLVGKNK